jgi:hypothetical protein
MTTYFEGKSRWKMLAHFCYMLTILFIICSATAIAQIGSDKLTMIHWVDASNPNAAKAFVSVVQARRVRPIEEPIMGLSSIELNATAFEVYVDGRRIDKFQPEVFDASPEGIDVVLAIDISGSAYQNFDLVRNAINKYIDNRREGKDQIAILTFGSDFRITEFQIPGQGVPSAFTDDVNKLKQFIAPKPPLR